MPKVPFPHFLETRSSGYKQTMLRVVTDQDVNQGGYLVEKKGHQYDEKANQHVPIYSVFEIREIIEKRPAKGDWSAWDSHPFYYHVTGKSLGTMTEAEVKPFLN